MKLHRNIEHIKKDYMEE